MLPNIEFFYASTKAPHVGIAYGGGCYLRQAKLQQGSKPTAVGGGCGKEGGDIRRKAPVQSTSSKRCFSPMESKRTLNNAVFVYDTIGIKGALVGTLRTAQVNV